MISHEDWVETIEERLEMDVFSIFDDSSDSGTFRFVVLLDEAFSDH
jgi:hypothetical protein